MEESEGVSRLLAEAGVDARRLRDALGLLSDGSWWTLADLVRVTATSRRGVEALLRELGPQRSGDRFRLPPARAAAYRGLRDPAGGLTDPVGHLLDRHPGAVERMAGLIAGAPRGRQALDHVSATPGTVVRRALLLGARFWLPGARVLCVGDHDLTSLAVARLHPEAEVTVVDIDERVLAYIAGRAAEEGLTVRTRWADLRLGLPPSVREQADLVITDPPYTPEGIGLFAARAVEGLRDIERGRVLLAYGAGERSPMLAHKVQAALHDLALVTEAMYPDFNRYFGAEAIGSAADLYILRPTTRSRPAAAARADRFAAAIYTHGPSSVESRPTGAPAPRTGDDGFTPALLVGDWPKDTFPKTPRVRPAVWLAKPYASSPTHVAITVPPGLEPSTPRLLLATRADHVRLLLPAPLPTLGGPGTDPGDLWPELLSPTGPLAAVYEIKVTGTVVDAVRVPMPQDAAGRLVRGILDNAHGKLANTWREGLIRACDGLTKRQARAVVAEAAPWAEDVTPLELPAHRLDELPDAVAASLRLGAVAREPAK
ncbi:bis-aminopropyl spermidine synthase family protein [Sphaerisporangium aureirubrum]|uniref:Bis-aminopropyl spermidine synthase family protein n=1 Tax=Sphaerisporangium aureirubrum TaxID=1544736 RepID=A0ABW1NNC6_9ACTN